MNRQAEEAALTVVGAYARNRAHRIDGGDRAVDDEPNSRRRSLDEENAPELHSEGPGPERLALGGDVRRRLEAALERMSARERAAFVLRHFEGRSVKEIELALGIDTTSVKQSVCRAVRKAREVLAPLQGAAS